MGQPGGFVFHPRVCKPSATRPHKRNGLKLWEANKKKKQAEEYKDLIAPGVNHWVFEGWLTPEDEGTLMERPLWRHHCSRLIIGWQREKLKHAKSCKIYGNGGKED